MKFTNRRWKRTLEANPSPQNPDGFEKVPERKQMVTVARLLK